MAEYKNGRLQLPMVTLCAMTSVDIQATIQAMQYSMRDIDFGDAVLITDHRPLGMHASKPPAAGSAIPSGQSAVVHSIYSGNYKSTGHPEESSVESSEGSPEESSVESSEGSSEESSVESSEGSSEEGSSNNSEGNFEGSPEESRYQFNMRDWKSTKTVRTIRYEHTSRLNSIDDFNYKMVYELGSHIHTPYAMIVHADGFIVHPECWRDEFLDYDYIGAPWPLPKPGDTTTYRDPQGNICRVGNSVGIRSKALMDFPKANHIPWTGQYAFGKMWYHEDGFLCCRIRDKIEAAGMKIAPLEVAKYFSHEHMIPEVEGITPFAFHKWEGTNAQYPDFRKPTMTQLLKATAHKVLGR